MKVSFGTFLRSQFAKQPPVLKADLSGKTVIVLGANTGLGFEASKHFGSMNPGRLILACRSQSKGEAALEKLRTATGYTKAELWLIDLSDFESVKRFADKFERDGGRLDILVENAALSTPKFQPTKDGWESSLYVNDLATPLLAFLLLPAMIKTAERYSVIPRIVVVASETHYWVTLDKKVLQSPNILKTMGSAEYCTKDTMANRYPLTKMINIFFVRAFNDRLPVSTPLVIDAVNPGLCKTELMRDVKGFMAMIFGALMNVLAFTAEEGSRQLVFGAIAHPDKPDALRGQYLSACRIFEVSDFILSAEGVKAQNRIWNELVEILGDFDSRVLAIVHQYLTRSKV
ncbi:hypothetical protein R3P38DRAFT_3031127 [Favolaschia claudopus]|uniref:NAD(P)-binding protein n=1 Tax=Favolaschia claudopus TaxID=2862362 RepID=A0AAW0AEQ6_9AGAR